MSGFQRVAVCALLAAGSVAWAQAGKFQFKPYERPPRARKRIEVSDEYSLKTKFYEVLDTTTHELSQCTPGQLRQEATAKRLQEQIARMEGGLASVRHKRPPDHLWCPEWLGAWKTHVEERLAAARADGGKPAAPVAYKLEPGEKPPVADPPLDSAARSYFASDVYPELDRAARALQAAKPADFVDGPAREIRNGLTRMGNGLTKAPARHPHVAWCKGWIAAATRRVEELEAEGAKLKAERDAALAAEKKDVDARLTELATFFDPKSFSTELAPPFTRERVTEWIKNLKQWDQMSAKGLAEVERLAKEHPRYAEDPRVQRLTWWFGTAFAKAVKQGIAETVDWKEDTSSRMQGHVLKAIHKVENYLEGAAPSRRGPQGGLKEEMLRDDEQANRLLQEARAAVEACECRIAYARDYLGQPDATYEALLPKLVALQQKIEASAKGLFENARMPTSDSDDAQLPELAKAAFKTAKEGYAPQGEWKRLVVSCKQSRETNHRKTSWIDGEYIYTKTWTEHYDYFQVCLAEKVGADWRLVYYDLKRMEDDPNKEWFVGGRWVKHRIAEANIDK